ncbi:low affinity immunoglobulin gamma Fc region receptor II-b-like [Kryptolebias marmoratus]|uniref:low affinity immunoglobulin gamma Fc region receptor II-b-like n=1 Tax=Kryptolebias marmoratus TaxID=37003 RepID=UPI000D530966|nr:low affinity immunoglobulin gamma Fc region receptor II-b-like [Kryptolebias marmoratus]
MEITTLCAVVVCLRVIPSRSQFFQYESVALRCEDQGHPSDWRVKRNTSQQTNQDCSSYSNRRNDTKCFFESLYKTDSGVYWCESAGGRRSDTVNITVTDDLLILESPEHPVDEGDALTLHCRTGLTSFSPTHFFKDGLLIGSSSTGNFTIRSVSKSHEGSYKCNASGAGDSRHIWLAVRARRPGPPTPPLEYVLLPVAGGCLLLIVLMLLCLWRSHKGKVDRAVSYTDVTISQEGTPRRICDVGVVPTFYSRVKPETS